MIILSISFIILDKHENSWKSGGKSFRKENNSTEDEKFDSGKPSKFVVVSQYTYHREKNKTQKLSQFFYLL